MEEEFAPLAHKTLSIAKEMNFSTEVEEEEEKDKDQPLIQRKRGKRATEVPLKAEVLAKRTERLPQQLSAQKVESSSARASLKKKKTP